MLLSVGWSVRCRIEVQNAVKINMKEASVSMLTKTNTTSKRPERDCSQRLGQKSQALGEKSQGLGEKSQALKTELSDLDSE